MKLYYWLRYFFASDPYAMFAWWCKAENATWSSLEQLEALTSIYSNATTYNFWRLWWTLRPPKNPPF